jgi:hypothetical protein
MSSVQQDKHFCWQAKGDITCILLAWKGFLWQCGSIFKNLKNQQKGVTVQIIWFIISIHQVHLSSVLLSDLFNFIKEVCSQFVYCTDNIFFPSPLKLLHLESHSSPKKVVNLKELNFSLSPLSLWFIFLWYSISKVNYLLPSSLVTGATFTGLHGLHNL